MAYDARYGSYDRYRSRDDRDRGRDYQARGYDRDDYYDNRDQERSVPIDETDTLIASNKVEGTRVYNRRGERLGSIYNFMVDKRSGRVEYAVMSFGGFLGLGERYYPLPWEVLTYDERMGGYEIDLDLRMLERAPSFAYGEEPRFDRGYGRHVRDYYGMRH